MSGSTDRRKDSTAKGPGGAGAGAPSRGGLLGALLDGAEAQRKRAVDVLAGTVASYDQAGAAAPGEDPLLSLLRTLGRLLAGDRQRLHRVLAEAADRLVPAVERRLRALEGADLRRVVELAMALRSPGLLPALAALARGPDRRTAVLALQAAGAVKGPEATALLLESLAVEDLRWTAVALLGDRQAPEAMAAVVRLLGDPAPDVRLEAVRALLVFGDRRLVPYLARCAQADPEPRVREASAAAARRLASLHGMPLADADLRPAARVALPEDPFDRLLAQGRLAGASDVHLVPGSPPAFRVHGDFVDARPEPLSREECESLVLGAVPDRLRAGVLAEMAGDFSHVVPGVGRHRVNVFLERRGWSAVVRLIPGEPPRMRDLGLPPVVWEAASLTQGLVLVTGRSGSGKTSTMAALVDLINETRPVHVITLEDPVEFLHDRKKALVNQREIGRHSESFPAALRAALREDPDVLVVGEMRDLVTMRMAVEAAETGHLVVATLHTPTAVGAIQRLIETFPAAEQQQVRLMLADSLRMVVAQALVRRRSGRGRVGAFEVLPMTLATSALVRENKLAQLAALMQAGQRDGMKTLDNALLELVQAGEIAPEDAWARAVNKDAFKGILEGQAPRGTP